MCGIAGVVGANPGAGLKAPDLSHRGPDQSGTWTHDRIRFWHWRLSVVDLTPASDQPWITADGVSALVYNGEVYNAIELRKELASEGADFRSRGDTEIVLKMTLAKGHTGVESLRGMYAFAVWDGVRRRLVLARDPFGVKPLYYKMLPGGLAFASELPALLALLAERPEPDRAALWHLFTFGFVPAPLTAFEGVRKVQPGEVLEFDDHGVLQTCTRLPPPWLTRTRAHRPEGLGLRDAVIASVREQFEADVPVGLFLSGGIDSNVILAAARAAGLGTVKTFTVAFQDPLEGDSHDETDAARRAAGYFGAEHVEIPVTLGGPDALLEDLQRFGEPFANPTVLLTRLMSREAKKHVTVALSGAGGDEVFGGYPRYAAMKHWRLLAGPLGQGAGRVAAAATRLLGLRAPRALRRMSWITAGGDTPERAYLNWGYYLGEPEKHALLPGLVADAKDSLTCLRDGFRAGAAALNLALAGPSSDLSLFLPGNILAYTDIGSMSESLEVRVPFLDPDVTYLGLRAIKRRDLSFTRPKQTLRDLFAADMPPHVLTEKKRGFNPPLARWIRGPLDSLFDSEETRAFRREFVDEEELRRMRTAHQCGAEDYSQELLTVLSAGSWYRRWCA